MNGEPETANGSRPRLCFYDVFAQHYAQVPDDGKEILPLFLQLWSQSFVSQIFALLFHRWVFSEFYTQILFSVSLQSLYSSHTSKCLDYFNEFYWICEVSHWNQSISLFFSAGFVKWSHKVQLVHPKIGEAVYLSKSSGSFQNHVWSSSSLHFYSCKQTYVHLLCRIIMK